MGGHVVEASKHGVPTWTIIILHPIYLSQLVFQVSLFAPILFKDELKPQADRQIRKARVETIRSTRFF